MAQRSRKRANADSCICARVAAVGATGLLELRTISPGNIQQDDVVELAATPAYCVIARLARCGFAKGGDNRSGAVRVGGSYLTKTRWRRVSLRRLRIGYVKYERIAVADRGWRGNRRRRAR